MKLLRPLLMAALLTLPACGTLTKGSNAEPYPSTCAARCFEPCAELPTWATRADGSGDWDALAQLVIKIGAKGLYAQCDAARESCAQCLRRLERVDVIRIGPAPPDPLPE